MSEATPQIIRNNAIVSDDWIVLRPGKEMLPENVTVPQGKFIVPLKVWLAQKDALQCRPINGVWLSCDEQPDELKDSIRSLKIIAVDFPKFTDGRGYSITYNLRARLGYQGEIRAIGNVLRDQLFYLQRVGFDAFALSEGHSIENALKGLSDFSLTYQSSWDEKNPLFRRVNRTGDVQ